MASPSDAYSPKRMNIVFFHPDLGIGGAERLIVDAAVGLQELGHKVTIFTSHFDTKHCFEEARDGTLDVRVRGNTLPSKFFDKFHIILAILRQIHLVLAISLFSDELWNLKPDVFVADQLPACVPLLRWFFPKRQRTLFYCHFPDQLLVQHKEEGPMSIVKSIYRYPFDWFEGWSMGASDRILVNSNFTKSISKRVFPTLTEDLRVVYPCVDVKDGIDGSKEVLWKAAYKILLSINRFERKKDIGLAIRAYKALTETERKSTRLILAGGYDSRITENVEYHKELVAMAEKFGLKQTTAKTIPTALAIPSDIEVLFLLSIPGAFKNVLLQNASLLYYTPTNEHFGIVPVEAMQYGVPVLASNTGGPLETVVENKTGWLRAVDDVEAWTSITRRVLWELTPSERQQMSVDGKNRVQEHFTRSIMAKALESNIESMLKEKRSQFLERSDVIMFLGIAGTFLAALISLLANYFFPAPQKGQKTATAFAQVQRE